MNLPSFLFHHQSVVDWEGVVVVVVVGIFVKGGQCGLVGHLTQHPYTEYHDEQADGDDDEQREGEPAQHHGAAPDPGADAAVAKVLGDGAGGHRGRVLPQDRDEDEDARDEDDGQGDLGDGPTGEGFDLAVGALAVLLLVPAGEGGQEKEADEGEDYGDDSVEGGKT